MFVEPQAFAICILCFAEALSDPLAGSTGKYNLEHAIWIQHAHLTAHRLVQEDHHVILTGCGRTYSTDSPALIVAGVTGTS